MNSISESGQGLFSASVRLLNQPVVKESIKNLAGSVTFVLGLVEIYDIYQIAHGREISTEACSTSSNWIQIANKVVVVCAKISLILSAGVSRPGVFIISSIVGCVFSTAQLDRVFGPNTIFTVNPWHPRHVISIAAVLLALPSVVQSTYKGINWMCKKIRHYRNTPLQKVHYGPDSKIRLMTLFNTITSMPTLHIGNQIVQRVSSKYDQVILLL